MRIHLLLLCNYICHYFCELLLLLEISYFDRVADFLLSTIVFSVLKASIAIIFLRLLSFSVSSNFVQTFCSNHDLCMSTRQ